MAQILEQHQVWLNLVALLAAWPPAGLAGANPSTGGVALTGLGLSPVHHPFQSQVDLFGMVAYSCCPPPLISDHDAIIEGLAASKGAG